MSSWARTRTGLIVPESTLRQARRPKRPTCVDLFCGCGGFSLGMMQAGWQVLAGLDFDADAMLTYLVNLGSYPVDIHYIESEGRERANNAVERSLARRKKRGGKGALITMPVSGTGWIRNNPNVDPVRHFFFGDVRKISGAEILQTLGLEPGDVDCVCGGPPCQGFSMAGRRNVVDPRNSLVFEFARLVLEIGPRTFVMENVPGLLSMTTPEGVPVIDALCHVLEGGGFGTWEALKQSLLISSGAGAATQGRRVQGTSKRQRTRSVEDEDDEEQEQLSLFEEAVFP